MITKEQASISISILFALLLQGCRKDPAYPEIPVYPNWTIYNTINSELPDNRVWHVEIDNSAKVWLTTSNKILLSSYNGRDWENIEIPGAEANGQLARGLSIDNSNHIWFNLKFDITLKYSDEDGWTTYDSNETGMFYGHVFTLKHDQLGNVYFSTAGGLIRFDGINWIRYDLSNSGITSNEVISLAIDIDNSVWLSAFGHPVFGGQSGVSHFDGSNWTTYNTNNSGIPTNAPRIAVKNNGVKWFVAGFNAVYFNGSSWTEILLPNDGTGSVTRLYVDQFDNIWFCTSESGLIKFDGIRWTVYRTNNSGIPSNSVNDVAVGSDGNIWVATSTGLAVFTE